MNCTSYQILLLGWESHGNGWKVLGWRAGVLWAVSCWKGSLLLVPESCTGKQAFLRMRLGSIFFSSTVNYHYKAQWTTIIGIIALALNNHCPDQQRAELAVSWSSCCVHALTPRGWLAWIGHVTVSISFWSSQFVLFGNGLLTLRTLICGSCSVLCFHFIQFRSKSYRVQSLLSE